MNSMGLTLITSVDDLTDNNYINNCKKKRPLWNPFSQFLKVISNGDVLGA